MVESPTKRGQDSPTTNAINSDRNTAPKRILKTMLRNDWNSSDNSVNLTPESRSPVKYSAPKTFNKSEASAPGNKYSADNNKNNSSRIASNLREFPQRLKQVTFSEAKKAERSKN